MGITEITEAEQPAGTNADQPEFSVPQQPAYEAGASVANARIAEAMLASASTSAKLGTVPDLRLRRLAGVSVWALSLAICGIITGIAAMIYMMGEVPGWFQPTFVAIGVFGLALTIMAFATVRFKMVPWLLLSAATGTLFISLVLLSNI